MNVLVYLVPMALGLGLAGLFAFLWALKSGQYSDVDGAVLRVRTTTSTRRLSAAARSPSAIRCEFRVIIDRVAVLPLSPRKSNVCEAWDTALQMRVPFGYLSVRSHSI